MAIFEVFVKVRIQVRACCAQNAETHVIRMLENHLEQMLDSPAVLDARLEQRDDNPKVEKSGL